MRKFNVGDRVMVKLRSDVPEGHDFTNRWIKWWGEHEMKTVFIISSIRSGHTSGRGEYFMRLNDNAVHPPGGGGRATFYDGELMFAKDTELFDDELFVI